MNITIKWKGDLCFEGVDNSGKSIIIDVPADLGGSDKGMTPMETLLVSLGGCTGIDVITILKKMRSDIKMFNIEIDADRAVTHPKKFTNININYQLSGSNLEKEKVEKAIKLTQEKYCSVLKSLNADFTHNFEINGIKY